MFDFMSTNLDDVYVIFVGKRSINITRQSFKGTRNSASMI